MKNISYKKYILRILIAALGASAFIGIIIFLFGEFSEVQTQVLFTTLTIGVFSLTALCSASIQKHFKIFSLIGILNSSIALGISLIAVWQIIDFNTIWQTTLIFSILSFTIAYGSLMLHITPKTNAIRYGFIASMASLSCVGLMLIWLTLTEFENSQVSFKLLGVVSMMALLGTLISLVLNAITNKSTS